MNGKVKDKMQKELNYTCDLVTVNVALRPFEASKTDDLCNFIASLAVTVRIVAGMGRCGCDKAR